VFFFQLKNFFGLDNLLLYGKRNSGVKRWIASLWCLYKWVGRERVYDGNKKLKQTTTLFLGEWLF